MGITRTYDLEVFYVKFEKPEEYDYFLDEVLDRIAATFDGGCVGLDDDVITVPCVGSHCDNTHDVPGRNACFKFEKLGDALNTAKAFRFVSPVMSYYVEAVDEDDSVAEDSPDRIVLCDEVFDEWFRFPVEEDEELPPGSGATLN